MPLYDISRPLSKTIAVWPGDTSYSFGLAWKMAEGASVNVGTVTMSVHTGTHVDAPFHFESAGETAEAMDLQPFLGAAIVVDVRGAEIIEWDMLEDLPFEQAPRLLLRTDGWSDDSTFPEKIPVLAADVPSRLAERGVVLVGLDVPSVDTIDSKDLPNHHGLGRYGIRILESLDLSGVPDGIYTLSALPLKLAGADASPVRAVLF